MHSIQSSGRYAKPLSNQYIYVMHVCSSGDWPLSVADARWSMVRLEEGPAWRDVGSDQ